MKKFSILWLLFCVVLLVAPTLAQGTAEEETPKVAIADETGLFSLVLQPQIREQISSNGGDNGRVVRAIGAFVASVTNVRHPPINAEGA